MLYHIIHFLIFPCLRSDTVELWDLQTVLQSNCISFQISLSSFMDDLVIGKVNYRRIAYFEVHYILGFSIFELSQRRFEFLYTLAGMGMCYMHPVYVELHTVKHSCVVCVHRGQKLCFRASLSHNMSRKEMLLLIDS